MITPTLGCLFRGIVCTTCGALLAQYAYSYFGPLGGVAGFFCGAIAVYLLIWWLLVGRVLWLYPLPICRRGNCQDYENYKWRLNTILGWEPWGKYRYRCACEGEGCEEEYVRKGKRFLIVGPNKELRPYKKLIGFRKWGEDTNDAESHRQGLSESS